MGVGAGLYMCDVVKKSSRSLSHLLMSSCYFCQPSELYAYVLGNLNLQVASFKPCSNNARIQPRHRCRLFRLFIISEIVSKVRL